MAETIVCIVIGVVIGIPAARLFWMFWPLGRGLSGASGTSLFSGGLLRRITLHEAGHAVAAWSCTYVVKVISVSVNAEGGDCNYATPRNATADAQWCHVVIALAGLAAETAEFPKVRSGYAMDDLVKARAFAEKCVGTAPPWKDPGGKTLPFAAMLRPDLSLDEARVLSIGYRMAKHVVAAHGDRVSRLASLVAARGSVDTNEMTQLFGSRVFIGLSGMFRSTFVLPKRAEEEERAA